MNEPTPPVKVEQAGGERSQKTVEAPPKKNGILIVDKPSGMTSHDVVSRVRRALKTKKVGHCGTLDPMATGVLVLAIGQGTKLVPYLTADDKSYEATLLLGIHTDSLDADGTVVREEPVPEFDLKHADAISQTFVGPHQQRAPKVSAIKVNGERLHKKARRGDDFEAPLREVTLHQVELLKKEQHHLSFRLTTGKGFYVRSFGRDLAAKLGTVGHLVKLRRLASGSFVEADACLLDEVAERPLMALTEAVSKVMPLVQLDETQALDAYCGRRVLGLPADLQAPVALIFDDRLVAIARPEEEGAKILRGFAKD